MDRYLVTQQSPYSHRPVLMGIALIDPKLERSIIWQSLVERQGLDNAGRAQDAPHGSSDQAGGT
jgi:hypothetical protein